MTPIRFPRARGLAWLFTGVLAVVFSSALVGCGDSAPREGMAEKNPAADQAQKNMEDFMKNQGKSKKK